MAVAKYSVDDYEEMIVEVSDSSLDDDRNVMRPLYAESGIEEFWIANLRDGCLEVYRGPRPTR